LEHLVARVPRKKRRARCASKSRAPLGESKNNGDVFRALAKAMNLEEPALFETDETLASIAFDWSHPLMKGITFESLKRDGFAQMNMAAAPFAEGGFPTPSGKVEFYSERAKSMGLSPYPTFIPPAEQASEKYPLALNTPPYRHYMNSTFASVARYRKDAPAPTIEIHPDDAGPREIVSGQMVRVFNDRGSVKLKAVVNALTTPGCVTAQSLWWMGDTPDGQGINALTSQKLTDMGGGATFYDCRVDIVTLPN
jgi:anaerobic selenocysteine-containing dehydrogenase